MKIKTIFNMLRGILILLLMQYSAAVWSQVTCTINPSGVNPVVNIGGIPPISVTGDMNIFSSQMGQHVLFSGVLDITGGSSSLSLADCSLTSGTASENVSLQLYKKVSGGVVDGTSGNVFKTNIPGIGVIFSSVGTGSIDSGALTNTDSIPTEGSRWTGVVNSGTTVSPSFDSGQATKLAFTLVVTGPVTPGVLDASSFPQIEYRLYGTSDSGNVNKLPARYQIINFSGTINITAPTCTTPGNVNVDLGDHTAAELEQNGHTDWVKVPFYLTNCGVFKGTYGNAYVDASVGKTTFSTTNGPVSGTSNVNVASLAPVVPNYVWVTFSANQGFIDATNGIVNTVQGAGQATGVAVQYADNNYNPIVMTGTGPTWVLWWWQWSGMPLVPLPSDGTSTIEIPLNVRLLKNGDVSVGNVLSQVTYTVNYM